MRPRIAPPNTLDRLIGYVSPEAALRRLRARTVYNAVSGGYQGARKDRRATQEWLVNAGTSADGDLLPDLALLRERSRDLDRNMPLARGAISTVVTNVVGTGLRLRAQIDREVLGMSEDEADAWERGAENVWRLWSESPECDVTRTQPFVGLQELAFRSVLLNGDIFALKRFVERPGFPFGTRVQLIEADRISNPNRRRDGVGGISGGVERDGDGAPLAYWISNSHPGEGMLTWQRVDAFAPSGRRQMLHLFRRLRTNQSRGEPYLAPVIEPIKQLGRYSEAEVMAAVISSMFTIFVKSEGGSGLAPASPTAETGGATTDLDYKLGTGAILDLQPGESIEIADPKRPNAQFDPFVMAVLRQVGVALELPFEILIKHFTASYSAARAALLEAWKFFRARRAWLAADFCQPIYEDVISEAIARGMLPAPGFDDPFMRAAYLGAEWVGPAAGQLDPSKEATANEIMVDRGWKTDAEVTSEMTGGDWERKHAQRIKETRMRREAGLEPVAAPTPQPAALPPPDDDEPDTENE